MSSPTDFLPFVQVPAGESPVVLERLDVAVNIAGMFAETAQTMTFRNPNRRVLEGSLVVALPDGATVCGYAIDLDGVLVDGVIVAKQEARRILEVEIRKGVDPGLVEQVAGNSYRARIYPLPPGGTRTVRLSYVSELAVDGNAAAYHLPLGHAANIDAVSLRVHIAKGDAVPVASGAGLGNLTLVDLSHGYVAEATLPRGATCDDLLVRLPDLPRHLRAVERSAPDGPGHDAYFAISSAVPPTTTAWQPRRVALLWDASGSRDRVDDPGKSPTGDKDLELVAAIVDTWPQLTIDVRIVRDVVAAETKTFTGKADRDRLVAHLRDAPRDGGTGLAALDLTALSQVAEQAVQIDAWLVFSDGLGTIGRGVPAAARVPVIAISSAARTDAAYLRELAGRSGGVHVDLLATRVAAAIELIKTARDALRIVGSDGCADVHVRRVAGRLAILGRLTAPIGQVRLAGSGAPDDHISIPSAMAAPGGLIARAWAGAHTRALAVADADDPHILELARRHGVVTANASLLVLDTLAQHLEHGIAPAPSRKPLYDQYMTARGDVDRRKRDEVKGHVDQVVAMWRKRVEWWETVHQPREHQPHPKTMTGTVGSARSTRAGGAMPPPAMAMMPPGAQPGTMPPPAPMPAPAPMMAAAPTARARMEAPAMEASADMAAAPEMDLERGAPVPAQREAAPAAGRSIRIKPWQADAPYLRELRDSADPYRAYLAARPGYATSPAFFLDCGDWLLGRDRALGLRVLSNLLELGLDDPPLMRMYAWRLQQAGELDAAIDVFERVRRMRGDEPQSHRDLALALGDRWQRAGDAADAADITRAIDLLFDVIEQPWQRFPEIELIAAMELNRLIALARGKRVDIPSRIDPRLVRLLDLDIRISMSWDLDLTDVDLHVYEPNGEHAYYGQNQTSGGGLVSRDFREGYGPEEYVRRRAAPGKYVIKAHYYGSHQQTIAGACTVTVQVTLDFGRPTEQRQVLTLRLDRPSNEAVVGEIAFAGAAPPADWRPRFKQLRVGMAIDEITNVVGQPSRVQGDVVLVYELAGDVVHVVLAPRLVAVKQVMAGAELDLL